MPIGSVWRQLACLILAMLWRKSARYCAGREIYRLIPNPCLPRRMIALRLDPIKRIVETVTEFKDLQNAE
jgi:hypothetical protein